MACAGNDHLGDPCPHYGTSMHRPVLSSTTSESRHGPPGRNANETCGGAPCMAQAPAPRGCARPNRQMGATDRICPGSAARLTRRHHKAKNPMLVKCSYDCTD